MCSLKISLENFDPVKKPIQCINSPRSLKVCKRENIDPLELYYISLGAYKKMMRGFCLEEKFVSVRWKHYEESRKEKVNYLLKCREELIEIERKKRWALIVPEEEKLTEHHNVVKKPREINDYEVLMSQIGLRVEEMDAEEELKIRKRKKELKAIERAKEIKRYNKELERERWARVEMSKLLTARIEHAKLEEQLLRKKALRTSLQSTSLYETNYTLAKDLT